MQKNIFTIVFSAMFVFLPTLTFAQVTVSQRVSLSAVPVNPTPGETVNLSVSSSEIDINLSNIEWFVDGKSVKKGLGAKTFSLTAPANGKTSTVNVKVSPRSGSTIQDSITFSPSEIDIIWEAVDSYVPPFYKGKALPIKQSALKVIAIPDVRGSGSSMIKPTDFSYNWQKDGQNMQGQSGYSKQSLSYVNQLLEDTNRIDVVASTGSKSVRGGLIISYFEPDINFYEVDNSIGAKYQNSLVNGFKPTFSSFSFVAEPYFLPKNWRTDPNSTFEWRLNNQKVNSKDKGTLSINTASQMGNFTVSVAYNETKKLFRNFSKSLTATAK